MLGRQPALKDKRLIFCINPGRSGSKYLAKLLSSAENVHGFHEAEPSMAEKYLHMVNRKPLVKSFRKRRVKCRAINKTLRQLPQNAVYCETNHMFIKTFFDVVLNEFKHAEVIILRRELSLVLKSFVELKYFTRDNPPSFDWMTRPDAATAALPCAYPYADMDHVDRCIAYLIDIEARTQRFKREYAGTRVHEIRLESLVHGNGVRSFFNELGIVYTRHTDQVLTQKVNAKKGRKAKFNNPIDLETCKERINRYLAAARAAGIRPPDTLALDNP